VWDLCLKLKRKLYPKRTLPKKQNNLAYYYSHVGFCNYNKTLEQYSNPYYEYSNEDFDYYGITSESLCPICKLDHEDEEGVEGNYKFGSYCYGRVVWSLGEQLIFRVGVFFRPGDVTRLASCYRP